MRGFKRHVISLFSRAIIVLTLSLLACSRLVAQENLAGKWISYSVTYRNKEVEMKSKYDKLILHFGRDSRYKKLFYAFKDYPRSDFSYHLLDGKTEDASGNVLKRKKIKKQGTYQLKKNAIEFATASEKYSQLYQLQGEILILKEFGQDASDFYVIKFKRVQ